MNLESRVNRLERQRPAKAGRIIPIWASNENDLSRRIEEMKRSGAMTDRDTVVVTMWLSVGDNAIPLPPNSATGP